MNITTFTLEQLLHKVAQDFYDYSEQNDKIIHIAVSGGNTPKKFFKAIKDYPIKWKNIHLWWVDDRLVPVDSVESNYGEAKRILLDYIAIPESNVHRIVGEATNYIIEASRYSSEIMENVPLDAENCPVFDWVILGMGADGHTASLFPGKIDLTETKFAIVAQHPETAQYRISLSAPAIMHAKRVTFIVTGADKHDMLTKIKNKTITVPAGLVKSILGKTEWFVDEAAASGITKN